MATTTYSTDDDVLARLQLSAADRENLTQQGVIDRWRVAAFRKIAGEFRKLGAAPPTTADVDAAGEEEMIKLLVDGEADWAAGLYRENAMEITEHSRPERDKSFVWKARALKDSILPVARSLHGANRVRSTRKDII